MESYYQAPPSSFVRQPVRLLFVLLDSPSFGLIFCHIQLNYHLYTPASHISTLAKSDPPQASFFMSESLRVELTQRSEAIRAAPAPSNLPDELQGYHTLVLLDQPPPSGGPAAKDRRPNFGVWHSSVYKATSSTDGLAYVLRRIESMFWVFFNFHSLVKLFSHRFSAPS